jgi:hypothetical protein
LAPDGEEVLRNEEEKRDKKFCLLASAISLPLEIRVRFSPFVKQVKKDFVLKLQCVSGIWAS